MIYRIQVIKTKFLGPTQSKGKRIKASCHAKTRFYDYDYGMSQDENHETSAKKLQKELNWNSFKLVGGQLDCFSFVFVQVPK